MDYSLTFHSSSSHSCFQMYRPWTIFACSTSTSSLFSMSILLVCSFFHVCFYLFFLSVLVNLAIPSIQMAHYIFFSYIDPGYMTYPLVTFLLLMIYKQIDYESREEQLTPTKISISFELFNNPTPSLLTSVFDSFVFSFYRSVSLYWFISIVLRCCFWFQLPCNMWRFSLWFMLFSLSSSCIPSAHSDSIHSYKPDRLKPNSIVLYIFNLLSYIQLAISIIYQVYILLCIGFDIVSPHSRTESSRLRSSGSLQYIWLPEICL